jgi:eukaryotic-like serine/threonine-protein kinase
MSTEDVSRVGDYEVLAQIGSGGMGRVYKVRNVISNREEAMKILRPDFAKEAEFAARFMAEIRTLAALDHPNIAQLRTAFQIDNQFVMVMEFVEGTSLDKLGAQLQGKLDTVLDYATQVLGALSYAHGRGVIHRDIKPANIMITLHGVAKLMDFGIAKSANDMNLTVPGATIGSIYYMSPEQVRGGAIDSRTDIYSFGVTLYEMLTGGKPFKAETSYSVLNAQVSETPVAPAVANPAIPQALSDVVMRAMAKDPAQRFQTAEEFRAALSELRKTQAAILAEADTVVGTAPRVAPAAPTTQASAAAAVQTAPAAVTQAAAAPGMQGVSPVTTQSAPAAAQQGEPAFTPVVVPAVPKRPSPSNRGLWMTLGALVALAVLFAAGMTLPRFFAMRAAQRSAGKASPAVAASAAQPAAPSATAATSSAEPASGTAAAPAPNPTMTSAAASASPVVPVAAKPSAGKARSAAVAPVAASEPAAAQNSAPATPAGPSPEEVRAAQDRFSDLDARAQAASGNVQQLRRQQQAQGYDMRGDILAAMARMNNDMRAADQALRANDVAAAKDYMDKANREIETLEKFLGR